MGILILIIASLLIGMGLTYLFLDPSEKIKANELTELDVLDSGYGDKIGELLKNDINSAVVERYFYLKHKYNLTKNKK